MARRIKLLFIATLAFTVCILLYTSRLRESHTPDQRTLQDFYHKTKGALGGQSGAGGDAAAKPPTIVDMDDDGDIDEEDARLAREMQSRLKAAEQQAKDNANAKSPNRPDAPSNVIGVGSSAEGQGKAAAAAAAAGGSAVGAGDASAADTSVAQAEEAKAVTAELESIMKRSPGRSLSSSQC